MNVRIKRVPTGPAEIPAARKKHTSYTGRRRREDGHPSPPGIASVARRPGPGLRALLLASLLAAALAAGGDDQRVDGAGTPPHQGRPELLREQEARPRLALPADLVLTILDFAFPSPLYREDAEFLHDALGVPANLDAFAPFPLYRGDAEVLNNEHGVPFHPERFPPFWDRFERAGDQFEVSDEGRTIEKPEVGWSTALTRVWPLSRRGRVTATLTMDRAWLPGCVRFSVLAPDPAQPQLNLNQNLMQLLHRVPARWMYDPSGCIYTNGPRLFSTGGLSNGDQLKVVIERGHLQFLVKRRGWLWDDADFVPLKRSGFGGPVPPIDLRAIPEGTEIALAVSVIGSAKVSFC